MRVTNNSLKHVHVCHSLPVTSLRQDIASALWRAFRQLLPPPYRPVVRRQENFRPSCAKFSATTPSFLHVFVRAPGDLWSCVVEFKSDAPLLRYSTCNTVTLKPGLGVTQGHRKLYHSIGATMTSYHHHQVFISGNLAHTHNTHQNTSCTQKHKKAQEAQKTQKRIKHTEKRTLVLLNVMGHLLTFHSNHRPIGSHRCRIEWYNFWWPWVTPNPGFKVTVYLQVEYLKTVRFRDKVTK